MLVRVSKEQNKIICFLCKHFFNNSYINIFFIENIEALLILKMQLAFERFMTAKTE